MKKFLVVLLVAFIIIQFFRIDQTNPPVTKGMDFLTAKKRLIPLLQILEMRVTIAIPMKQNILGTPTFNLLLGS